MFFRYLPGATGHSPGTFNSFQTELTITGKISRSKKKAFGIHGGFAFLFTIATVEEIGTTQIHDPESGKTTSYVPESSEERRARHAKEAVSVCESNSLALDKVLTEFQSPDEEITLEGRLGRRDRSRNINRLRLATIRDYFINCAGVLGERVIIREGDRTDLEGRVNVFRAGKLSKVLLAGGDVNICLKSCIAPPNKLLHRTAR